MSSVVPRDALRVRGSIHPLRLMLMASEVVVEVVVEPSNRVYSPMLGCLMADSG